MAESSWPNPATDRTIDDAQYEKLGAYYGPAGGMHGDFTSPVIFGDSSGMQIKVLADRYALVRGHTWWSGSTTFTKAISSNASGSTRTDLVVLRLDRSTWAVTCEVKTGTPGSGAPALTQSLTTTGTWELPLATVTVASGAATITSGNVTYVAPHLAPDGGPLRSNAYSYVPHPFPGQKVTSSDGTEATYNGTDFLETWGWRDYTPTVYQNLTTTRSVLSGTTINVARYLQRHKEIHVHLEVTCANAGSNGVSVTLPTAATSRWIPVGAGGVYGGSAPTQSGVACIAPGPPYDSVMFTTFSNAFVSVPAGHIFRAQITYEAATGAP